MDFLKKYGIEIKNINLLQTALTHSSYANEHKCFDYERLEFLGDAVLQLVMSDYFYKNTKFDEGQMSKIRQGYVCEKALAGYVKKMGYEKHIRVGQGMLDNVNDTILADTFEAVLAVIYIECGYEACKKFIKKVVIPSVENDEVFFENYKSTLQEFLQTTKKSLEYVLVSKDGEGINISYTVNVVVDGIVFGSGTGRSKQEAEQNAAAAALKKCAR